MLFESEFALEDGAALLFGAVAKKADYIRRCYSRDRRLSRNDVKLDHRTKVCARQFPADLSTQ